MERLGLDTIKVGFVYNIVLCRKSVIGADRSWDRANGQDLRVEWSNSSRNAKKIFSLCEGGQGGSGVGPHLPSEDQFWENILSILTFSRGKNNFFQSCSE